MKGMERKYMDFAQGFERKLKGLHWSEAPGILRIVSAVSLFAVWWVVMMFYTVVYLSHLCLAWLFSTREEFDEHWHGRKP